MREVAYFISDLHLGSEKEPKYFLFLQFLDKLIKDAPRHLFLMGDIFDLWIGQSPYFIQKHQEILLRLSELKKLGVDLHYFEGNHDLYLADYFQNQMGIQVHTGPIEIHLWGVKLRLEHGDQMDPGDRGYIFLRWFLRTSCVRFLLCHLPESWMIALGERASRMSREYTSQRVGDRDDLVREKIIKHARSVYSHNKFDALVAGHVHVREDQTFPAVDDPSGPNLSKKNMRVFNLGTWLREPWALVLSSDGSWQWLSLKT